MTRPKNLNALSDVVLKAHQANPKASLNELAQATGYSRTAVYYHLKNLQKHGVVIYVRRERASKKAANEPKVKNAGDAFRPRSTNKARTAEQKRIDMVVEAAQRKEAEGVVPAGVNMFFDHRIRRVLGRKTG